MLLLDAFRLHALHDAGNPLLEWEGGSLTYRQVWNVSELLGAHLIEHTAQGDLPQAEPVAVLGSQHPLALACQFAALKSNHPCYFLSLDQALAAQASGSLPRALLLANSFGGLPTSSPIALDAQLMLSYLVPGMSDDFSCGCGQEDCAHGPFLQECMPASWLDDDSLVRPAQAELEAMTAAQHDLALNAQLLGGQIIGASSLDICDILTAATIATGGAIWLAAGRL